MAVLAAKIGPSAVRNVPYTGDEARPVFTGEPIGQNPQPLVLVGSIDTVGGTMYDIWFNGPTSTLMYYDPNVGIHASFMYSNGAPATDRNMRYNFFDLSLTPPVWAYNQGPDFMLWGLNTFVIHTGFGMLDASDVTGCAWISAHQAGSGSTLQPVVAQDQVPGSGSFVYAPGEPTAGGMLWPAIGLTNSGTLHAMLTKDEGSVQNKMFYSNIPSLPDWAVPIPLPAPAPDAGFPDYNIATAHMSNSVVGIWPHMNANPATEPMRGYLRFSRDDGATWEDPIDVGFPPMFNHGDTQPTFNINSMFGMFDDQDFFHLVANLQPFRGGGVSWVPSAIWHWDLMNGWSKIVEAYSDTWVNPGSNCTWAGRPTLCQVNDTEFVCAWEMLDSLNVEPNTGQNRFRIFGARSTNRCLTWGAPVALRAGGASSYRYPSLARKAVRDTCHLIYLQDLEAGFAVASPPVGTMTANPVIHHKFWAGTLPPPVAIAEGKQVSPSRVALEAKPNPAHGASVISYALPKAGNVSLKVYDNAGRPVRTLIAGKVNPGGHTAAWDGRNDAGARLKAGVYFVTLATENAKVSRKLTLLQ
jgi:hypothetical protein